MSVSLLEQQDPVVWIQKISSLDKHYERESQKLLPLLTSIWSVVSTPPPTTLLFSSVCLGCLILRESFTFLKEQNHLLLECLEWIQMHQQRRNHLQDNAQSVLIPFPPSSSFFFLSHPFPRCRRVSQDDVKLVELVEDYDRALSDGLKHFTSFSSEENEQMIKRMTESLADHSKLLKSSWEKQRKTLFEASSSCRCSFDRPSLLIRALPSKLFRAMWTVVTPNSSHSVDKVTS